ncbi:MurR/RpiR family transcriptional regulator [Bowmanella sp. JS7-9]|uniref:MurR/RpiR family transcriptional regulator n=1 Tax=Pseudobowmanella zhangzhouensis TaxID=1537679 RepID=A0ABW1XNZ5_9ALTE|nr:SIS domain-containing protein [Bowmanella sp. JS7-9]TBX22057.1 RpiR family transcriptional regulator [Bowmanella sp. JS7-9]
MSVFVKLKALRDTFSDSEARLADFTLSSANVIRELSSVELARIAGVSQSSVVKFAQKLGFKGYPAFKLGVIDSLNSETGDVRLHSKVTLNDSLAQISAKLLESKMAVLTETKNLNTAEAFEQAVSLLKAAKRILIIGLGGSALVGKDFSYKLQKLGMAAIAEPDGHAQLAYVATFGKDDLVVAISESGQTREVIKAVQQAQANDCPVVSITQYAANPVSDCASVKLYSVAEKESVRLSSILARTAQEFVIDILFIAITQSSRTGRKMLEKTNQLIGDFRRN